MDDINLGGYDVSALSDSLDKEVSEDEFKSSVTYILKDILNKRFYNEPLKQVVRHKSKEINFSCPYCGDSTQDPRKRRGNVILKGKFKNFFKCHNCGKFKRVDHFLSDFQKDINFEVINYVSQNINDIGLDDFKSYSADLLFDNTTIENYAITREFFKKILRLQEIKNTKANTWLKNRLQFGEKPFLYNPSQDYILILNLTKNDKVLGAVKRRFKFGGSTSKYEIKKLSTLYNDIYNRLQKLNKDTSKFDISKVSQEKIEQLDAFSQLFNITNLNISRPITLFEGPLDAFLFKNSVGNSGLQKEFPIDIPLRYWFDDDNDGKKKTISKLEEGHTVFLWSKLRRDVGMPYRIKWDLNETLIYMKNNNIKVPNFEQYFSDDPLDIMDI